MSQFPRSFLYVPATQLERVDKAFAKGADAVIIDWEDAVSPEAKADARKATQGYLKNNSRPIWLRINAADSSEHSADITALADISAIDGIFLAKTQSAQEIEALQQSCQRPIIAIIETAQGILKLPQIAAAQGIRALTFGCLDLAHQLGIHPDSPAAEMFFDQLRINLLIQSHAHALMPPIDTVYPHFNNEQGFLAQAQKSHDLGFSGMMCIHPKQIPLLHQSWQASKEELSFARAVCKHYQQTGEAAFQLNGKMIDLPVIRRAQSLLANQSPDANKAT